MDFSIRETPKPVRHSGSNLGKNTSSDFCFYGSAKSRRHGGLPIYAKGTLFDRIHGFPLLQPFSFERTLLGHAGDAIL